MSHTNPYRIYLVTNTVTGKRYVGVTRMTLKQRMYAHKSNGHSSLSGDIQRYGRQAFSIETLETHTCREAAHARESELMVELGTLRPAGYNLTCRGEKYPGRGGAGKGNTNARATRIEQIDKDGNVVAVHRSIKAASETTGIYRTGINRVVHGQHQMAGGYHWKKRDER